MHAQPVRVLIPLIRSALVVLAICGSVIAQDIAAGAKVKLVTRECAANGVTRERLAG